MDLLTCEIQRYDWGDFTSISDLLGRQPPGGPEAELWMGAHPRACSKLPSGELLDHAIGQDPIGTLGPVVNRRFGQLPFLFKVLAAGKPLSIQSHPNLAQAQEGFARENDAGIPLDAPNRTYRDPNHKPELIAAITPFEAKCGFRSLSSARELFAELPVSDLDPIRSVLNEQGADGDVFSHALAYLLSAPDEIQATMAEATVTASGHVAVGSPFAQELAWSVKIAESFPGDIGVAVALLLNHVVLRPGQAIFLGAGNLHAYLRGVGMELMANSDNVVRGGLTSKHVDVQELLRVVDCTPLDAPVQTPESDQWAYHSPVPEFTLDRIIDPAGSMALDTRPEILFVQSGEAVLNGTDPLTAPAGSVVWIPASTGASYQLRGQSVVWRSRVGAVVES